MLVEEPWPIVATGDYMKAVPDQIARWVPQGIYSLGTDGFGRSETRADLRDHFEINSRYVTLAALRELARTGKFEKQALGAAYKVLEINPDKFDPMTAPKANALDA